jgi:hypothetical protein
MFSHGTSKETAMKTQRMLGCGAVVLILLGSACGTWLAGAGSALAPEPAKLVGTTALSQTGQIGPAAYLSGSPTKIVRWPSSAAANSDGSPAAGQPCTTTYLAPGASTMKVIVAAGSSRLCY